VITVLKKFGALSGFIRELTKPPFLGGGGGAKA